MLEQDPAKMPDTEVANESKARQTTQALRTILCQMVNESSKPPESRIPISAQPIQGALISRFSGGRSQEDAEEFLTHLLNEVSGSFCGNLGGAPPFQTQAWRNPAACMCGSTVQTCRCLMCQSSSSSVETPFFMLRIPLPEGHSATEYISDLVLHECTLDEQMTGDNKYDCSSCKRKTDGLRDNLIKIPPEVLVLQLKRFKFDADAGQTTKIMTPVHIDNRITLYCSNEETANYFLYSIVMHKGSGPNKGHYFSICRCSGCAANEEISSSSSPNPDRGEWRILDDEYVSEQNTLSACIAEAMGRHMNATPYVVFYARAHSLSTACPVCNGSRLKELAQKVAPLPGPTLSLPPPAPPSTSLPPVSEQAIADCIRCYMTTRTRVRITEVP
jgi:ubiquitin C-terminal hydrolase